MITPAVNFYFKGFRLGLTLRCYMDVSSFLRDRIATGSRIQCDRLSVDHQKHIFGGVRVRV